MSHYTVIIVIFCSLTTIICFFYFSSIPQSYGTVSPPFTTEEISDDTKDFVGVRDVNSYKIGNLSKCEIIGNDLHLANIDSIKYISDGRFLNATVWLSEPFSYEPNSTIYGMEVTTSLNVGFQPIKPSSTAEDLLESSIQFHNKYAYFEPIENRTFVTKKNHSAYELIYENIINDSSKTGNYGMDSKEAEIGIITGDKVILLEFSSLPALFSSDLPTLYTILDSVELLAFDESNSHKPDNYSIYTNSTYNLSMAYPSNWTKSQEIFSVRDNYTEIIHFEYSHSPSFDPHDLEIYNMVIDVHSTFDEGSDYLVRYIWSGKELGWQKYVVEISSNGYHRSLGIPESNVFKNHPPSSFNLDNFVSMDFDLQKANFPYQYSIYTYKENSFNIDDFDCHLVDTTGWIPIPPPKFSISAFPDSLELRPNEEKIVKIMIHNNSTLNAKFVISNKKDKQLDITINSPVVFLLPNGDTNMNLRIKNIADNTKESIPHTIPLDLTVSFPQNTTIFGQNVTLTNTEAAKTIQGYYFSVTTLPDLEAKDYINNLAAWLSPLNSIWAFLVAVGTVTIPLLLRLLSKQKQKDTDKQSQS